MNNNNNDEHIQKLEREIWLFEQWLGGLEGQSGDTQDRIRHAYKECITARKLELAKLQSGTMAPAKQTQHASKTSY